VASAQERRNKAFLWKFFNSSGFTTLLSVFIGGLFAQWINYVAQGALKERELEIAMLQERSKQARITHEENIKQQQQLVQRALTWIGGVVSSSENLLSIMRPEWRLERFSGEARARTEKQKADIRSAYNKADQDWTREKQYVGFLINFYSETPVSTPWRRLESSVDAYRECVENCYLKNPQGLPAEGNPCLSERNRLEQSLQEFGVALRNARNQQDHREP